MEKRICFLTILFLAAAAWAKEAVTPAKSLDLKPVSKTQSIDTDQAIRKLGPLDSICTIGAEKYSVHGKDDEDKCSARGGKVAVENKNEAKSIDIKVAPLPAPSRLQNLTDPALQKIQGNIHYNPVENH